MNRPSEDTMIVAIKDLSKVVRKEGVYFSYHFRIRIGLLLRLNLAVVAKSPSHFLSSNKPQSKSQLVRENLRE